MLLLFYLGLAFNISQQFQFIESSLYIILFLYSAVDLLANRVVVEPLSDSLLTAIIIIC